MPGPEPRRQPSSSTRTSRTRGGTTSGSSATWATDSSTELPDGISLKAEYADITDQVERKIRGIALYESQIDRLFGSTKAMADGVRSYAATTSELTGVGGYAERYWVSTTA